MNIYTAEEVLLGGTGFLLGIFSTIEKAKQLCETQGGGDPLCGIDGWRVCEYELNSKNNEIENVIFYKERR